MRSVSLAGLSSPVSRPPAPWGESSVDLERRHKETSLTRVERGRAQRQTHRGRGPERGARAPPSHETRGRARECALFQRRTRRTANKHFGFIHRHAPGRADLLTETQTQRGPYRLSAHFGRMASTSGEVPAEGSIDRSSSPGPEGAADAALAPCEAPGEIPW